MEKEKQCYREAREMLEDMYYNACEPIPRRHFSTMESYLADKLMQHNEEVNALGQQLADKEETLNAMDREIAALKAEIERLRCESFKDNEDERLFSGTAVEYIRKRAGKHRDHYNDPKQAARLYKLADSIDSMEAEIERKDEVIRNALYKTISDASMPYILRIELEQALQGEEE